MNRLRLLTGYELIWHLAKQWIPVIVRADYPLKNAKWTHEALECLRVNKDCSFCPVNQLYGFSYGQGCRMPEAVQLCLTTHPPLKYGLSFTTEGSSAIRRRGRTKRKRA